MQLFIIYCKFWTIECLSCSCHLFCFIIPISMVYYMYAYGRPHLRQLNLVKLPFCPPTPAHFLDFSSHRPWRLYCFPAVCVLPIDRLRPHQDCRTSRSRTRYRSQSTPALAAGIWKVATLYMDAVGTCSVTILATFMIDVSWRIERYQPWPRSFTGSLLAISSPFSASTFQGQFRPTRALIVGIITIVAIAIIDSTGRDPLWPLMLLTTPTSSP